MKWKIKEDRFNIYIPMFKEKWYKRYKYLSKQNGEYIIHKSFDSYWADSRVELISFKWDALNLIEEFVKSREKSKTMYRKLKRTWSHNDLNYIPRFKEQFPELDKVNSEELCDRFIALKMDFYCEEKAPVNFWMRLTLPFAILTMILMFLLLPINFLFTGNWGYNFEKRYLILLNWFRALRISF